jgi:hypothetical protein
MKPREQRGFFCFQGIYQTTSYFSPFWIRPETIGSQDFSGERRELILRFWHPRCPMSLENKNRTPSFKSEEFNRVTGNFWGEEN